MSTYLTTGFVLRVQPWREQDRLYTLLTASHGKLDVVAAGTRKGSSKLSSHLQPFSEVEVMVARGRAIDRLASARLTTTYLKPPYELPQLLVGSVLLELAAAFSSEGGREQELVEQLQAYLPQLKRLDSSGDWKPIARVVVACYLLEVLSAAGLTVPLTRCESCKAELCEPLAFSWQRHGFIHAEHAVAGEASTLVPQAVLQWLQEHVAGEAGSEGLPPRTLAFLADYAEAHLGRALTTLKVLRSATGS